MCLLHPSGLPVRAILFSPLLCQAAVAALDDRLEPPPAHLGELVRRPQEGRDDAGFRVAQVVQRGPPVHARLAQLLERPDERRVGRRAALAEHADGVPDALAERLAEVGEVDLLAQQINDPRRWSRRSLWPPT